MIYNSAVEQIKGARASESEMLAPVFRLATVSSLLNGRAYVQFYGETTASTKLYPYLAGYKPTVGDKVLVLQQGSTFIIAGKISKDNVVDNYYMTKALSDAAGYLTKAVADTLYMPIGSSINDARYLANNNYALGFNNTTTNVLTPGRRSTSVSGRVDLGNNNNRFGNVYAQQFYQNGTAISTSDRRMKTGIKEIGQNYIEFFRKLKPRLFRFKDGESGRLHSGFIAQEVDQAAAESGIPTKDLAFLCIDENGDYGLRYEELIAIQTQVIQDLLKRVEDLEETIKGGKG